MVPNSITCTTWPEVKQSLVSEFRSTQTLSNYNQAFMHIQIRVAETFQAFAERFYRKPQILVTLGKLELEFAFTAAVS